MTAKEKEIMRKIIYAVETGGQVYGNARYDDFTEAYTNSELEHAITIGAGQWYGSEAKKLLQLIREKYPEVFRARDTAGIASDLDCCDWNKYRQAKSSAKAKCIQAIIGSAEGRKCQDRMTDIQMEKYIKEAAGLGVNDIDGKMMCANFRHQGGYSAMERVIHKTSKPYTLNNLYAACKTDTGNQVGAYRSRQMMVFASLKKYLKKEPVILHGQAAVDLAKSRLGENQYTQGELRVRVFDGHSDCSSLVWKCFERAYGIYVGDWTGAQVEHGRRVALCRRRGSYGRLTQDEVHIMQPGDCIYYGAGCAKHVEMYIGAGQQIGHGSGIGPTIKNCLEYGHPSGVYQIRRFVADDLPYTPDEPDTPSGGGENVLFTGVVTARELNVRCWYGLNADGEYYPLIKSCPVLEKGQQVQVLCAYKYDSAIWYKVKVLNKYIGFVHGSWIERI